MYNQDAYKYYNTLGQEELTSATDFAHGIYVPGSYFDEEQIKICELVLVLSLCLGNKSTTCWTVLQRVVCMNDSTAGTKTRDTLVAALTFAAGLIDALSFLALGGVFSSFMSGNTVLLGLRIGLGDFPLALNSTVAILGYIAGVALGTGIGYQSSRSDKIWPFAVTKILSAEFIIIATFTSVGYIAGRSSSEVVYLLILLASTSMGMQATAVRGLGISGVTSTYVTGTWTSFIIGVIGLLRSRSSQGTLKRKQDTFVQAVILAAYIVGAITGGLVGTHFLLEATIIPGSTVGVVLIVAWIRFRQIG